MSAVVYSKTDCVYCDRAKALLRENDVTFREVHLRSVHELDGILKGKGVHRGNLTFPQIFLDDEYVGGFDKLQDALDEPILKRNELRFTPFPVRHFEIWELYKKSLACFWLPQEVDLSKDRASWNTLSDGERYFISHVLAFFASSDGIVMENLDSNFTEEIQIPEARQVYAIQQAMEAIHSHVYGLLLDTYIQDEAEKAHLFSAIQTIPSVKAKANWAMKYMNRQEQRFSTRLLAFACVEGLLFSGSFCAVYFLKKRGVMPGLCLSNDFIARDEGLHTETAVAIFHKLRHKPSTTLVHKLVAEAVEHEKCFITEALPCDLIGMNRRLMAQYISYVADRLLMQLGYPTIYDVDNPFDFMENIALESKVSFFEVRNHNYSRANVMQDRAGDDWTTDTGDF